MRRNQTKFESLIETSINIATGFCVSYAVWLYVVPIFWPEHASGHGTAFGITCLFTVSSVIRSYFWRRFFEREIHRAIHARLIAK